MRILITGNLGYVGPGVERRLAERRPEAELVGFDIGYFAHLLTAAPALPEIRLDRQIFGDVRRPPADLFAGIDAVVHLAAISNDPMGKAFEEVTMAVNHRASLDLARRAREAGVSRFVFASSCSTYGLAGEGKRTESDPVHPLTAYARSKVATEHDLAELAGPDFQVTCLRFATACGMSDRLRLDLVLNDFVASALTRGEIVVLSDGTPWRPLIHVEDMARAVDWAVGREVGPDHLVVNVGSDEWNHQIGPLAEAAAAALPGVSVSIDAEAPPDKRSYAVDFALYRRLAPDHQPRVTLEEAVVELAEGLTAMGFADEAFRTTRWMRLKALSELREEGWLDGELRWTS